MTFQGRWFGWVEMMAEWERLPAMSQLFSSGKIATGAHNDFLQMLFHGGIVGLVIYLSLLIVIGVRIGRNLLAKADEMAVAALMVFLMWLIDAVGLVPSAYPAEQWLIWGLIGMSFRMRADAAREEPVKEGVHERDDASHEAPLVRGHCSAPISTSVRPKVRFNMSVRLLLFTCLLVFGLFSLWSCSRGGQNIWR